MDQQSRGERIADAVDLAERGTWHLKIREFGQARELFQAAADIAAELWDAEDAAPQSGTEREEGRGSG